MATDTTRNEEEVEEDGYSAESHLIYGKMDDPRWDYSHHLLPPISGSATFRLDSAAARRAGVRRIRALERRSHGRRESADLYL